MNDSRYLAIYFRMGMYNKDDNVPSDLIGFDCPFDDSPVLYARNEKELEEKIKKVYAGNLEEAVDLETERDWDGMALTGKAFFQILFVTIKEIFKQNYMR